MTPTEKHRETAREVVMGWATSDGLVGLEDRVATALANEWREGEREGMETERTRCADIVERFAPGGDLYSEVFIDNDVAIRVAIRGEILSEAGEG